MLLKNKGKGYTLLQLKSKTKFMIKFLCCLLATVSAFSEMKTIHSLDEISTHEFSKKTLVMLDLYRVLIYPKDALLQNYRSEWKPEGMRTWTDEEDTIAWMSAKFQILDPAGPKLLATLYEKKVPTIGITSFAMDQAGIVESIPKWLSQHLKELGLNFKIQEEIIFPIQKGFVPPSFENGVLYCGDCYKKDKENKGKIVSLYLDWLDWTPEKVVLVDDSKNHLESVEKELKRRGIPFFGFHYIPKDLDPIDEKVAELQYKTIIEQKMWISDEEAKSHLIFKKYSSKVLERKGLDGSGRGEDQTILVLCSLGPHRLLFVANRW